MPQQPSNQYRYWQLTLFFALCTLVMSAYLLPMFPSDAHIDVSGYGSPVFAFEMASSPKDIEAVFGPTTDPQRAVRIAKMDKGNRWDFGFMFLYAAFLSLFCFAAYSVTQKRLWLAASIIGLSSGGFDAVENVILLKLSSDANSLNLLSVLWMPVYAKFAAIALSSFAAAYYIYRTSNLAWKLVSIIAMIASLITIVALISPQQHGWVLQHTITLSWLPMLVFSGYRSFTINQPIERN